MAESNWKSFRFAFSVTQKVDPIRRDILYPCMSVLAIQKGSHKGGTGIVQRIETECGRFFVYNLEAALLD